MDNAIWITTVLLYIVLIGMMIGSKINLPFLLAAFLASLISSPLYVTLADLIGAYNAFWIVDILCLGVYTRTSIVILTNKSAYISAIGVLMTFYNVLDLVSIILVRRDYNAAIGIQHVLRYVNLATLFIYIPLLMMYAKEMKGDPNERK